MKRRCLFDLEKSENITETPCPLCNQVCYSILQGNHENRMCRKAHSRFEDLKFEVQILNEMNPLLCVPQCYGSCWHPEQRVRTNQHLGPSALRSHGKLRDVALTAKHGMLQNNSMVLRSQCRLHRRNMHEVPFSFTFRNLTVFCPIDLWAAQADRQNTNAREISAQALHVGYLIDLNHAECWLCLQQVGVTYGSAAAGLWHTCPEGLRLSPPWAPPLGWVAP